MVKIVDRIKNRAKAIPNNAKMTFQELKTQSVVDAAAGAGKRFGKANRELVRF